MNQELNLSLPTRGRVSRTNLFLFLILGLSASLYPIILAHPEDPDLWCINWRGIFRQASIFARLAAFVIIGYLKNFYKKYGLIRISIYLIFVTFISYVFVAHGLDKAAMMSWKWFEGNVIRRLDDSIILVDENRNETTSMRRLEEKPFSVEEHFRYNDEDVRFRCYDSMAFNSEVGPTERQVIWKHNGAIVVPSWKFHIEFSFVDVTDGKSKEKEENKTNEQHNSSGLHTYNIDSTLTIYLVEDADYGNYSCHLRESARIKNKVSQTDYTKQKPKPKPNNYFIDGFPICICIGFDEIVAQFQEMLSDFYEQIQLLLQMQMLEEEAQHMNTYQWTGEFKLTKIKKTVLTVSAPPGGIVSISASFLNLAEKEDVSLDYVINHKASHNVCTDNFNGCSLLVFGYWTLWHPRGYFRLLPELFSYWLQMQSSILGVGWQCVCPSTYGIHVFRFNRHFYNISSGRKELFEVEHPRVVKLIPREADVLLAFQNESKPETIGGKGGEECLDYVPFISSCSWMETIIHKLNTYYFLIENLIFILMVVFGLIIFYLCDKLLISLIVACRNVILEGSFWPCLCGQEPQETLGSIGHAGLPCRYDVYISHADSQSDMAWDLASKLESFGKRVFFRDRDVALGDLTIEAVSDAIVSSGMFLILVSQEYIDSGFQNRFEFQLILNRILEGIVPYESVMLLKHGPCNIPTVFCNFTNVKILNMNNIYAQDLTREVKLWSNCKKDEDSNRVSFFFIVYVKCMLRNGIHYAKNICGR